MTSASKGSVYAEKAGPAVARMSKDEQNGTAPEAVGLLLYRIVNTANPRLRYTVGPAPQRAAVWLKRLLPNAVMERIVRSQYSC